MHKRAAIITAVFLATFWGAVSTETLADDLRPTHPTSQHFNDEAFATYVDWASEDLQEKSLLRISVGATRIPIGLLEEPGTPGYGGTFDRSPTYAGSTGRPSGVDDITGVGIKVHLPAGFAYELHYGAGEGDDTSRFVKSLELGLDAHINRAEVSSIYGGTFSWQTPVTGFTVKGGISQMQLTADGVTLDGPLWSTTGVDANTQANLFNTARTWRASAEQRLGNLRLSAEYIQNQIDVTLNDHIQTSRVGEGYTGKAAYQVTDWFQLGSSYSLYYADRSDKKGETLAAVGKNPAGAWIRDIGVSARFDFTNRVALQLEGHFMNGLLGVVEGSDEDWRRFGARMTINF